MAAFLDRGETAWKSYQLTRFCLFSGPSVVSEKFASLIRDGFSSFRDGKMARKWMTCADESSSARLITVPYERLKLPIAGSATGSKRTCPPAVGLTKLTKRNTRSSWLADRL